MRRHSLAVRRESPAAPPGNRKDVWIPGVTLLVTSYVAASHMSIGGLGRARRLVLRGDVQERRLRLGPHPARRARHHRRRRELPSPAGASPTASSGGVQQLGLALTIAGALTEKKGPASDDCAPVASAIPDVQVGAGNLRLTWQF